MPSDRITRLVTALRRASLNGRLLIPCLVIGAAGLAWIAAAAAGMNGGEVFFSGDGGLKALLVKQFARGVWDVHLHLAGPAWAQALWRQGLFPFAPPFAYPDHAGYVVSFPFAFAVLAAPFYWAFGVLGLYAIPILALVVFWGLFGRTLTVMAVPPRAGVGVFFLLVFASYVSFYGAVFWEHTLGLLLAFPGLAYLATAENRGWTPRRAVACGLVCGLGFAVRSETLCLVAALAVIGLASWRRDRRAAHLGLVGGLIAGVAIVLALNWAVYGLPLGAHALQMRDPGALDRGEDKVSVGHIAAALGGNFLLYNPVCAFVLLALALLPAGADRRRLRRLLAVMALVLAMVPWIVPNSGGLQHGPRYLLQVAPALYLAAAILLAQTLALGRGWRKTVLLGCLALSGLGGIGLNAIEATVVLHRSEQARTAPLRQLTVDPTPIVAVDDTVIAQEMEAAMRDRLFFLADTAQRRTALIKAATANGARDLLYVRPAQGAPSPDILWPSSPGLRFRCQAAGFYLICKAPLAGVQ
jgi:hypothetical protein